MSLTDSFRVILNPVLPSHSGTRSMLRDPVRGMTVLLGMAVLIGLAKVLATITSPFPFSNEGWTAYHAADAAFGGVLYPPTDGLIYNNYPPLGYFLIGGLGRLLGDIILAGRIISIAAFLALIGGVFAALRAMAAERRAALFGAGVFAGTFAFDYDYVGVCDPQIIANTVQIWGLVVLLRAPRSAARMALAALIFVTAFFVKHAVIAQTLVAGLWLLLTDRKAGWKFAAFGIAFGFLGLAVFRGVFGQDLLAHLHDPRVWWINFALWAMGGRIPAAILPLAAIGFSAWRFRHDRHVAFCVAYLLVSIALAFWFLGGAGTGGKMLFDAVIALGLCAGIGVARWRKADPRAEKWFALCQFLPVVMILAFKGVTGKMPHHWLPPEHPAVRHSDDDIAFLSAQNGRVLCGEPALCFRAGKPFEIDLWGYQEAVAAGARDGHELLELIRTRRFSVLQLGRPPNALDAPPEGDPKWSATVSRAIMENYKIAYTSTNGAMWVVKVGAPSTVLSSPAERSEGKGNQGPTAAQRQRQ